MLDLCMRYERIGRRCEATKSRTKGRSGHEVPNPVIESSACRHVDDTTGPEMARGLSDMVRGFNHFGGMWLPCFRYNNDT